MSTLFHEGNKKQYKIERAGNFYYRITADHFADKHCVITDGHFLWIAAQNAWCPRCFSLRYHCFKERETFMGSPSGDVAQYDQKLAWCNDAFFAFLVSQLEHARKSDPAVWWLWDVRSGTLMRSHFDIAYPICERCNPRKIGDGDRMLSEGERLCDALYEKINQSQSYDFETLWKQLVDEVTNESFGLVSFWSTFKDAGLDEDILEGRYVATLLTSLFSCDGKLPERVLTGGQDYDEKVAQTKALMEYVERFALRNKVFSSPVYISDRAAERSPDLSMYLDQYEEQARPSAFMEYFNGRHIWAVDYIKSTPALLPLACFYDVYSMVDADQGRLPRGWITPTSSGASAHFSCAKAIDNAVLEYVERDAFIRWWLSPTTGEAIALEGKEAESAEKIRAAIVRATGNESVALRCLYLPSPTDIPVVLALLTSASLHHAPALLVGCSGALTLAEAQSGALAELRVGVLNFLAQFQKDPHFFEREKRASFDTLETPHDHMKLYYYPQTFGQLTFMPELLAREHNLNTEIDRSGRAVSDYIADAGYQCYVIDTTPPQFDHLTLSSVRCFIPQLYAMYFGHPMPFKMDFLGKGSVAGVVPHPFP